MPILSPSEWDGFLENFPNSHLLQTLPWAKLKINFGWQAAWFSWKTTDFEIGSQILFRRLIPGFTIAYMPKGPVYDHTKIPYHPPWAEYWKQVDRLCRSRSAIFLKVEPDLWINSEPYQDLAKSLQQQDNPDHSIALQSNQPPKGFRSSNHSIQPLRTIIVSLSGDENDILSRMKQKTRYNIKLAQRKGVQVRSSSDISAFHQLMQVTGIRDGFGVHTLEYYQDAFKLFNQVELSKPRMNLLVAEYENAQLAALMVFTHGKRAWYLYGASSNAHREKMPTYLLQWEAMRWARNQGCVDYDFWGTPDANLATLEANFSDKHEDLWGVYRFKRGFGGELRRAAGPWDRVYQPTLYFIYRWRMGRRLDKMPGQI